MLHSVVARSHAGRVPIDAAECWSLLLSAMPRTQSGMGCVGTIEFRLEGSSVARLSMGELEGRVMDVLWDHPDEWFKPGDVHKVLSKRRPIAYTTVMTILVRLWQKEQVERRSAGRAYAYHPTATREAHAADRMGEILASAGDRGLALNQFLASLTAGDRARLRKILERRSRR